MAELNDGFTITQSTVALTGGLDSSNAARPQARVEAMLTRRPTRIVFDLTELGLMDSTGIAVLVTVAGTVGEVSLRKASSILRRVLEASGLTKPRRLEP